MIVTHEMDVVKSICTHVSVMEKGRIVDSFSREDGEFRPAAASTGTYRDQILGRAGKVMFDSVLQYQAQMWDSIGETFVMVGISVGAAVLLGLPLGTLLFFSEKGSFMRIQRCLWCSTVSLILSARFRFCCWSLR